MNVVISFQKIGSGSYEMASLKIAKFVASMTSAQIVDDMNSAVGVLSSGKQIKTLFVVSGMWQFCKTRDLFVEVCKKAFSDGARMFFCSNEYTNPVPSPIKNVFSSGFTTLSNERINKPGWLNINWNAITFTIKQECWIGKPISPNTLLYYGAHRENRAGDFDTYLNGNIFQTVISTSKMNESKFKKHGSVCFDDCKSVEILCKKYGFTVYMTDKRNHKSVYVCPANRFYECLSFGLLQFIDRKAMLSFSRGFEGVDLSPFVVESIGDILKKKPFFESLRDLQVKTLATKNYKTELIGDFLNAVR